MSWWSRWFGNAKSAHLQRGEGGEKLACRYLKRNGYKVLYRNFRGKTGGEIDIVCRDGDTLVFVEVKTRADDQFGRPIESIKRDQQRRIARGALAWLRLLGNPEDILFRFDVVEVIMGTTGKPRLELVQNAFGLPDGYRY
ncbi:YraN family protein [soil metagenome]